MRETAVVLLTFLLGASVVPAQTSSRAEAPGATAARSFEPAGADAAWERVKEGWMRSARGDGMSLDERLSFAADVRAFATTYPSHPEAFNSFVSHEVLLRQSSASPEERRKASDDLRQRAAGTGAEVFYKLVEASSLRKPGDDRDYYAALERLESERPGDVNVLRAMAEVVCSLRHDPAARTSKIDALLSNAALDAKSRERLERWMAREGRIGTAVRFQFTDLNGAAIDTADWEGKVIVVDFWATWCGPCVAELPRIKELYDKRHAEGLEVIGVNCDKKPEAAAKFVAKRGLPWPQWPSRGDVPLHPEATKWGIDAIPVLMLIDKKGVLRSIDARSRLEEQVQELLAEEM